MQLVPDSHRSYRMGDGRCILKLITAVKPIQIKKEE